MESAVIDSNESYVLILVKSLGTGSEVGHSAADCDNCVSILCNDVGCVSTGYADTAQTHGMAGYTGTLAGLGLAERNLELLTEILYSLACCGILHTAAYDDQGLLSVQDYFCYII